jgi:hypothetical protein
MVICPPKFVQRGDWRLNGDQRNSRDDEDVAYRKSPHENRTEKAGYSYFGSPRIAWHKFGPGSIRQTTQDVGGGSQEDIRSPTQTMGEIPSTASLRAIRSDQTAFRLDIFCAINRTSPRSLSFKWPSRRRNFTSSRASLRELPHAISSAVFRLGRF